jgi:small subunit ribosomal protein S17
MPENPTTEPEGDAVIDESTASAATTTETAAAPQESGPQESGPQESGPQGSEPAKATAATQPAPAKAAAKEAAPTPMSRRASQAAPASSEAPRTTRRKVREGIVVSNGMEKTAVVVVIERVRHPRYAKTVQRTKRLYAHDETNDVRVGDRVRLVETRPQSKLKRWRVERVLERAR